MFKLQTTSISTHSPVSSRLVTSLRPLNGGYWGRYLRSRRYSPAPFAHEFILLTRSHSHHTCTQQTAHSILTQPRHTIFAYVQAQHRRVCAHHFNYRVVLYLYLYVLSANTARRQNNHTHTHTQTATHTQYLIAHIT